MIRYVIRRLLLIIPTLLGVMLVIFTINFFIPGDPAILALGTNYSEEAYAEKRAEMGLDQPFIVRYVDYVVGVATRLDLGTSYDSHQPVSKEIFSSRLGITLKVGILHNQPQLEQTSVTAPPKKSAGKSGGNPSFDSTTAESLSDMFSVFFSGGGKKNELDDYRSGGSKFTPLQSGQQVSSYQALEENLKKRSGTIKIITGHTGWTDDLEFAFRHRTELCAPFKKRMHDPAAPYDGYDETDDTEEKARGARLAKQVDHAGK